MGPLFGAAPPAAKAAAARATQGLRARRKLRQSLGRAGAAASQDGSGVAAVAEVLKELSTRVDSAMTKVKGDFEGQVGTINDRFEKHAANQELLLEKLGQLLEQKQR
jgi:hypothetical protein